MNSIYKIEIDLYPNNTEDVSMPFFWCLKSFSGNNWCTDNAGWDCSPQKAWEAAYDFYLKYKNE